MYGFEIKKDFYKDSKILIQKHLTKKIEIDKFGFAKTLITKINPTLF